MLVVDNVESLMVVAVPVEEGYLMISQSPPLLYTILVQPAGERVSAGIWKQDIYPLTPYVNQFGWLIE